MKTTVVIADEYLCVRQMVAGLLQSEGDYELLANVGSGIDALNNCRVLKPQLLILDLVLPEMCGLELLRQLRTELRETRFLIFSRSNDREMTRAALQARPHGFVGKSDPLDVFREALRAVAAGSCFLSPFAASFLDEVFTAPGKKPTLTSRECMVMQMIAEGRSTKEIASRLAVAEKTIDHNRTSLMRKLNVHSIAGLTQTAIRQGLVTLD